MTKLVQAELCPNRDLNAYIASVYQIPMLSDLEEKTLGNDLFYRNNLESAQKLVLAHLRVVVSVSRQYLSYGLPQGDLIQEGNVGLMKAVKRFDPSKGVKLFSFAIHWIKAEMQEYILKNWKIVKVATTKAQRKLFFNLRSLKKKLGCSESLSQLEAGEIASRLKVSKNEVDEMNVRLSYSDASIESNSSDFFGHSLSAIDADPFDIVSGKEHRTQVNQSLRMAIQDMDKRSRYILESRWLNVSEGTKPLTLKEIAKNIGVSAERVRQIECNALKNLKKKLGQSF